MQKTLSGANLIRPPPKLLQTYTSPGKYQDPLTDKRLGAKNMSTKELRQLLHQSQISHVSDRALKSSELQIIHANQKVNDLLYQFLQQSNPEQTAKHEKRKSQPFSDPSMAA